MTAALVFLLAVRDPLERQLIAHRLNPHLIDVCVALGAAVCLLQAYLLASDASLSRAMALRIRRLLLFSFGLGVIVALNQIETSSAFVSLQGIVFGRSSPIFLLVYLAAVALFELGSEHKLVKSTPISPFHRRPVLPPSVPGALLSVDLKNSERILRQGARVGEAGRFTQDCLSLLWEAVSGHGGVVLQTEGDALVALFPLESCPEPARAALAAADSMAVSLRELATKVPGAGGAALAFRGSIVEGEVRPVWLGAAGERSACWTSSGSRAPAPRRVS